MPGSVDRLEGEVIMGVRVFPLVLLIAMGCASSRPQGSLSEDSLLLDVAVQHELVDGAPHPVAYVRIRNVSGSVVAFSETFGITNRPWLSLHIVTIEGKQVYYPVEIDVFRDSPKYRCLGPGEVVEVRIDLLSWHPTFGGQPAAEAYSFELAPGRYRIRALYTDEPGRVRARCLGIAGTTSSEWAEFTLDGRELGSSGFLRANTSGS